jgi:urease accessory protein
LERRGARTVLAGQRMTPPLQVMAPMELADGSAYVVILNNGGGLVGGDSMRIEIELGSGSRAAITTASAGKVYRTTGPSASHQTTIRLGAGARLDYLPDHLIPHAGAALIQRLTVMMETGSRAILYGALAAGRIGRGERFAFRRIEDSTAVWYDGRPILLSRALLEPAKRALDGAGLMEQSDYIASLVVAGESCEKWGAVAAGLQERLQTAGVSGGASPLTSAGCQVRWMAPGAEVLRRSAAAIYGEAARMAFGESPIALRK